MRLSPRFRRLALLATTALIAATPSIAHADPITTAVAAFVYSIGGAAAAAAVGNFLVAFGGVIYGTVGTWALSKLSGSKVASASQERQAQVTSLTLGEVPREAIVGRAGTGGSLADAYYYGGENGTDWNVFVVPLADHPCDGLEGVWVNDKYEAFAGDGDVAGYNGQLRIWWRPGEADDAPLPSEIAALGPATADGNLKGVARVIVAYKADAPDSKTPIWTAGRPQFLWVVRGARVYDPREDDTVPGGEGPQRWDDPSTWTWKENAELCRYAYDRGFYAFNDTTDPNRLRVGRGLTAYEAPPERIIAAANLCDELVEVSEGVSEPRYRVGGVIRGNEAFGKVEQDFADAMGGYVIQPDGGVGIEPGQAKTPVAFITDDDILVDKPISVTPFRSASDRVNTVIARYAEPSQKYADTAAGVRRDLDDIVRDGQPLEETLPLSGLVTYRTQAERLAEYRRKQHRLERLASITLGPRFAALEEGDWIEWRSRRWNNEPKLFRITAYSLNQGWQNTLSLEETAVEVFGFGSTYTPAEPQETGLPPGALALADVEAFAVSLEGENEELIPAVQFSWATPVDAAIEHIRAEIRPVGAAATAYTVTSEVNQGSMTATNGVSPAASIQVRLAPLAGPGRAIIPSPWITLRTGDLVATDTKKFGDVVAEDIRNAIDKVRAAQLEIEKLRAEAQVKIDKLLGGLNEAIDGKPLAPVVKEHRETIVSTLVKVGENTAAIEYETLARQTAVSAEAYARLALATSFDTFTASTAQQFSAVTTDLDAVAALTASLNTDYSGFKASANTALLANSNAIEALTTSQTQLATTVGNNKAAADASLLTLTNTTSSLSSSLTSLTTTVGNNKSSADASISSLTTQQSATATTLSNLSSDYGSFKASASSSITTLSNAQGAQATTLSNLSVTVGSHTASISSISSAQATTAGKVNAVFGFALDVNGKVVGVKAANDGSVGALEFNFDYVRFTGDVFIDGSLTTRVLANGAASGVSTFENASSMGFSAASEATHLSFNYTAYGTGSVVLLTYVDIGATGATAVGANVRIYCDGVLIGGGTPFCQGSWGGMGLTIPAQHSPSAGSHNYTVTYQATPGSGGARANRTFVVVLEMKK